MESLFEQSSSSSNTQDDEVQEAYKLANTITMGHLNRKLQADPTADLSSILEQQASQYPELRNGLAQDARDAATKAMKRQDDQISTTEVQDSLKDDAIKVSHPLCRELLAFAGLEGQVTDDELVSALMPKLHRLMRAGGHILFSLHDTSVLSLSETEVVKIGSTSLNPEGITNLHYINSHLPQIPSPKFLGSLMSRQRIYVFMSRGKGTTLEELWPQLQVADKQSVQKQLNDIFRVLRATQLRPDDNPRKIGGFMSGLCQDMRRWPRSCEDLSTEAEFNDFLCRHENTRRTQTPWIKMIRSFMKNDHKLVMTHGDLHPRNIMVDWEEGRKDIKITSILDWEMAGWYPEYWEFVKALATADERGPLRDWCDYLPTEAIGQWPTEYSIDLLISRWIG